jgi:hypothetical protein
MSISRTSRVALLVKASLPFAPLPAPMLNSNMANGQVVLVTTERLEGGPVMRTVYYVAEEDPTKAQAIVAALMAPNEKVEAYGLLPEAAVKALGLKPGEFRHA